MAILFDARDYMYMSVKNDLAGVRAIVHADVDAIEHERSFERPGNDADRFCNGEPRSLIDRKYILTVLFWYHQCVAGVERLNVEECECVLILIYFSTWDFSANNFAKEAVLHSW